MTEALQFALQSPVGSFGFIFGIMVIAGWLIYFVTKHVTRINACHDTLIKDADKAEKRFDDRFGKFENNINSIHTDLTVMKARFDAFYESNNSLAKHHSPISLTDKGYQVSNDLDIKGKIAVNWTVIASLIESEVKADKNAYDIQQFCIDIATVGLDKLFSEKDVLEIKNYAFNQGRPLAYYGIMIGIELRDAYFRHKGIDIKDVDKCDPNNNSNS